MIIKIGNVDPVEHRPPLKRIDLYGQKPTAKADVGYEEAYERREQIKEGERIWTLIRQSIEGTGAAATPVPVESDQDEDLIFFAKSGGPIL